MVADLGCLGCAFKSGKYSSPFNHAILSDKLYAAPHTICLTELFRGQNTNRDFQQQEAGVTPEGRRDRGRDFAARWGRSRLSSCFGCVLVHPVLLVHLVVSSAAYVSAWVTLGVKSPAKGRLFI